MVYEMRLHPIPFELIRSGSKVIEIRLNDEKRQQLHIGDQIEFVLRPEQTDTFKAEISGLDIFNSFKDAYSSYEPIVYGAQSQNEWKDMYKYYSSEDEAKYGVLGIHLRLLN
jgi:ASC-1-like (ASCH) protein